LQILFSIVCCIAANNLARLRRLRRGCDPAVPLAAGAGVAGTVTGCTKLVAAGRGTWRSLDLAQ
jgi:hypothetical protein